MPIERQVLSFAFFALLISCGGTSERDSAPSEQADDLSASGHSDGKNISNVPGLSPAELERREAARRRCVTRCVLSRQMEAVSHTTIQQQCADQCMDEHFVGQVRVIERSDAPSADSGPPTD